MAPWPTRRAQAMSMYICTRVHVYVHAHRGLSDKPTPHVHAKSDLRAGSQHLVAAQADAHRQSHPCACLLGQGCASRVARACAVCMCVCTCIHATRRHARTCVTNSAEALCCVWDAPAHHGVADQALAAQPPLFDGAPPSSYACMQRVLAESVCRPRLGAPRRHNGQMPQTGSR